jgi:membrane-associated phospholipid phosphatase
MPGSRRFSPPTGRALGATVLVLVVTLAVLTAALVAIGWVITHPLEGTMAHENALNRWFADQRTTTLTDVADGGTFVGQTLTGAVALAVLGIGFAVWRRTWWPIVFVAVLDAGLGLFYLAGTSLDPRRRPPVHILQAGLVPDHSFPSGHTGTATGIAAAAAALLWAYTRIAAGVLVALVVIPLWTMLARLYAGAHHLSDVLTAFVIASIWLVTCARLLLPPRRSTPADSADDGSAGDRRRRTVAEQGG